MDRYSSLMWLELVFGVGGKRLWQVLSRDDDPFEVCQQVRSGDVEGLSSSESDRASQISFEEAERLISRAQELGQQTVCIGDNDYPVRLAAMEDAPALIFCRGDIRLANEKTVIHIVGTREPSKYTLSLTDVLCADLALRGFAVSCGLAEGTDTRAAEAVLAREGTLISVYPTSLENEYPKDSGDIKDRLVQKGLLISEYPPEYNGRPNFRRRNKLAVALASAVVIAEASEDSKGLDNAYRAIDTGRPVLAVPPHILYEKRYFGQRELLRKGCMPIFDGSDVVNVLAERHEISPEGYVLKTNGQTSDRTPQESSGQISDVQKTRKAENTLKTHSLNLSDEERKLLDLLKENGAMTLDELVRKSGLPMNEVYTRLISLELLKAVVSLPGQRYELDS